MARKITDYIDAAKARLHTESDRQLSRRFSSLSTVSMWRAGARHPSQGDMIRLAMLAGIDPVEAVADLGIWKAKDDPTRDVWERILAMSQRTTAAVLLSACFLWSTPDQAAAFAEHDGNKGTANSRAMYIM